MKQKYFPFKILGMQLFAVILKDICHLRPMRYHLATNVAFQIWENRGIVAISTCPLTKKLENFLGFPVINMFFKA